MAKLLTNYESDLGKIFYFSRATLVTVNNLSLEAVKEFLPSEIRSLINQFPNKAAECQHPSLKKERMLHINNEAILITCPLPFSQIDLVSFLNNPEIDNFYYTGERLDDYFLNNLKQYG